MLKRIIDITASLTALLLFLPLFLVICVLIRLDSRGGAFFGHERVGKNGRLFKMIKFRSMVKDASKIGGFRTDANDARITKVGAFLRKTSLDELPQLLNVLIGDMSLVGPRPDTPMQEGDYTAEQWNQRCAVKPGITGLAQAMGRSGLNHQERLDYDLEYAANPSLKNDVHILMKTVNIVLKRAGTN